MRVVLAGVVGLTLWSLPAQADPALGLWLTEADRKGQVAHVNIHKCSGAICGKIVKVLAPSGKQISHKNVGRLIFWNTSPAGGGRYTGRALVPAFNTEYNAEMTLSGNRLKVGGCKGPICQSQTWKRIK